MKTIDVVGAVITNEEGQILCALRSEKMSQPGMWEFPGGKIESGETHEQSLVREIREELGCEILVGELLSDDTYEYPAVRVRLITYFAAIGSGTPVPNEHEKLEWVDRADLMRLEWARADIPAVEKLVGKR
ncbi:(deoxy)nucleoside triphosphate pyrophosphohydrolase [Paenibacillus turpanensis]|uniref:(deoxy)nucleoside triphosphate pyrophosphohydrolase n=1 Tax=Paenibacillus turpanensis TaxID=2689078 RepID=UPI00140ACE8C|nr:(deoxy)nucleoside triphosphate pyrophosphohydrolase [Paenibacillus turpanensis]